MEEAVLLYPERDGSFRAKAPGLRGLVIDSPDRELVQHLARCAITHCRRGSEPVFIDVSPEAAVEPNPWLDSAGVSADDPTWNEFVAEMKAGRAKRRPRIGPACCETPRGEERMGRRQGQTVQPGRAEHRDTSRAG